MGESLKDVPDTHDSLLYKLLADMGRLICEVLKGERMEMNGDGFLDLLGRIEGVDDLPFTTARDEVINIRPFIERDLRLLAICQELRRAAAEARGGRRQLTQLHKFLSEQIEKLEELLGEGAQRDPTLLVLKGVSALRLQAKPDVKNALDLVDQALRLGVESQGLVALREKQQNSLKEAKAAGTAALDLFDIYLADGSIPQEVRANFIRGDNLAELYRLNRNYAPADIMTDEVKLGVKALRQRLEHLGKYIASEQFNGDSRLGELKVELQDVISKLDGIEKDAQSCELEVMSLLADKLREQPVT
jgi:hypothetical protein